MANPLKGEVEFKAGEKTYTLVFDNNAIVEVETMLGRSIFGIMDLMSDKTKVELGHIRALLWGGLRRHYPNVTIVEAGDILGEVGGIAVVAEPIIKATAIALGLASRERGIETANPPQPGGLKA